MNSVNLIGRIATDPEIRYVGTEGTPLTTFRIAVYRNREESDFFNVVAFQKAAEFAAKLTKGQRIGVSGKIQEDKWEKDGQKRTAVKVVAYQIDLLEPKKESDVPF